MSHVSAWGILFCPTALLVLANAAEASNVKPAVLSACMLLGGTAALLYTEQVLLARVEAHRTGERPEE